MTTAVKEKAPPGWEPSVVKMKSDPSIDNPFALAYWMKDQGYNPGGSKKEGEAGDFHAAYEAFKAHETFEQYVDAYRGKESNAASSNGQLERPQKSHPATESSKFTFRTKLREAGAVNNDTREVPVIIIEEGMGNKVDKHFYTKEALSSAAPLWNGAKCYADHPSKTQEVDRPERSVRDIIGFFSESQYMEKDGRGQIRAILHINRGNAFNWAWDMLQEALDYGKKFPDQDYIGLSINADGISHPEENENNDIIHFVDSITHVVSADIVTQPAAGGKPLSSLREAGKKGGIPMHKEALMKAAEALKSHRAEVAKNKEDDSMYGPALDEIISQMSKLSDQGDGDGQEEAAPPPDKDGQLKDNPKADPKDEAPKPGDSVGKEVEAEAEAEGEAMGEEEMYAAEAEKYRTGKLNAGEKKLFEAWSNSRAAIRLIESEKMLTKKLSESGLAEAEVADLRLTLKGKPVAFVEKMIAARKSLMESIVGDRANGAGQRGAHGAPSTKLKEALVSNGIPMSKK